MPSYYELLLPALQAVAELGRIGVDWRDRGDGCQARGLQRHTAGRATQQRAIYRDPGRAAMAGSMDLASVGSGWSASRSSFSASVTAAALARAQSAISAVLWPVEATKAC